MGSKEQRICDKKEKYISVEESNTKIEQTDNDTKFGKMKEKDKFKENEKDLDQKDLPNTASSSVKERFDDLMKEFDKLSKSRELRMQENKYAEVELNTIMKDLKKTMRAIRQSTIILTTYRDFKENPNLLEERVERIIPYDAD